MEVNLVSDKLSRIPKDMTTGLIHQTEKGVPNGVGTLDDKGQQPMSQFPDKITKPVEFTSTVIINGKDLKAENDVIRLRSMFC